MTVSGRKRPSRSADSIIETPMRSFTEPAGLNDSIFTTTVAGRPLAMRFSFTSGVLPNVSARFSYIRAIGAITAAARERLRQGSPPRTPNTHSAVFRLSEKSLYVEAIDLWIDSMRSRDRCYVSHGHGDHAREHATIVATPNTAAICRARFARRERDPRQPALLEAPVPPRPQCAFEEHAFNRPWSDGEHVLTLFSAGHVLGSSQLLIESDAGRFV